MDEDRNILALVLDFIIIGSIDKFKQTNTLNKVEYHLFWIWFWNLDSNRESSRTLGKVEFTFLILDFSLKILKSRSRSERVSEFSSKDFSSWRLWYGVHKNYPSHLLVWSNLSKWRHILLNVLTGCSPWDTIVQKSSLWHKHILSSLISASRDLKTKSLYQFSSDTLLSTI